MIQKSLKFKIFHIINFDYIICFIQLLPGHPHFLFHPMSCSCVSCERINNIKNKNLNKATKILKVRQKKQQNNTITSSSFFPENRFFSHLRDPTHSFSLPNSSQTSPTPLQSVPFHLCFPSQKSRPPKDNSQK